MPIVRQLKCCPQMHGDVHHYVGRQHLQWCSEGTLRFWLPGVPVDISLAVDFLSAFTTAWEPSAHL